MELRATPTVSNFLPPLHRHRFSHTAIRFQPLLRFPLLRYKTGFDFVFVIFILLISSLLQSIIGFQPHRISSMRSTTSEEASTDTTGTFDGTNLAENEGDYESHLNKEEELEEGSLFDNPLKLFKFLDDLNIKLDYEQIYSYVAFGSGGAVAFWLIAAIVGAIDSIPVLPKALELVGLGYTLWFTSRFLILKKNRDEFFARVEELKHRVLGSNDDYY